MAKRKPLGTSANLKHLASLVVAKQSPARSKGPGEKGLGDSGLDYDDIVELVNQLDSPDQAIVLSEGEHFDLGKAKLQSVAIRLRNALSSDHRKAPLAKDSFLVRPIDAADAKKYYDTDNALLEISLKS